MRKMFFAKSEGLDKKVFSTCRLGTKWVEGGFNEQIELVDKNGFNLGFAKKRICLVGSFESLFDVKRQHITYSNVSATTVGALYMEMCAAYPGFQITDTVTVVFLRTKHNG